jgi:hypothetical protein
LIDRRRFLGVSALLGAGAALWPLRALARPRVVAQGARPAALPAETLAALGSSPLAYVSPLRSNGQESTCHGEVWFGWIDGAVVVITSSDRWKARSVKRGLDRARIWVGDRGRWKKMLGRNEAFRTAPSFDARAAIVANDALLEQLLEIYAKKYPKEIADWRDKMRAGYRDGSRVLIRYVPVGERTDRT